VEYQGRLFSHVRQQPPTVPAPGRHLPPKLQQGRRTPAKAKRSGRGNREENAPQADETDGEGPQDRQAAMLADDKGDSGSGKGDQSMPFESEDDRVAVERIMAMPATRDWSQGVDAMDYLRRSRIPGCEVLFRGRTEPPHGADLLAESLTSVMLSVLKGGGAATGMARRPSATALCLAAVQAAMEHQSAAQTPPSPMTTLLDIKRVLLKVGTELRNSDAQHAENAFALLPIQLLHVLGRPRTAQQQARSRLQLSLIRQTREWCEPVRTPSSEME
jgi:hypothetical protein